MGSGGNLSCQIKVVILSDDISIAGMDEQGPLTSDITHLMQNLAVEVSITQYLYTSGTVNSNTVNSKFHLIRSFCEIFARFLLFHVKNAWLIWTWLIQSSTNLKWF